MINFFRSKLFQTVHLFVGRSSPADEHHVEAGQAEDRDEEERDDAHHDDRHKNRSLLNGKKL